MLRRVLKWFAFGVVGLVLLALAALWSVDTGPGHRLLADRIAALAPNSGLRIRIGRIDGSIWRKATLRDVRLYDTQGLFAEAPEIALDWRPLAWSRNLLQIESVTADLVTLQRLPKLRSTGKQATLPGFDIHIGRLAIGTLRLAAPVAGRPTVAQVEARADLRDRRALIDLALASRLGDRVRLRLDAAPDADKFDLGARVAAPRGGVIGGIAGLKQPLALQIGGNGSWSVWNGRAQAAMAGRPLADLSLGVRDGHYLLDGRMIPAPFLQGKLQRLTTPVVRVRGDGTLADRQLEGRLRFDSPALRIAAGGTVDLAANQFRPLTIDLNLLQPAALFPNMSGRDLHLNAVLTGPFKTAGFRYRLTTPRVAFDATGFEGVVAEGAGQLSPAPVKLPIRLSARRVTGVGDVAGGILGNLRIGGVLAITATEVTGQGLTLDSDKLKGRLGLRLDLVSGRYDVALTGGLQRYLIPGLGIVDVDSRVSVVPGPGGRGTIIAGRGVAQVRRLDNAFFRSLAGGLPRIDTSLVRDPDGTVRFPALTLSAPSIRITGAGLRRRDGTFQFKGRGVQRQYGPFTIALDGDIAKPKVDLVFDRPLDALGLKAVRASLVPIAEGFRFTAAGGSTLGPFSANGRILLPPNQPAVIDIAALDVSGTRASGQLRSDPAGFTGRLQVAGGGITGPIAFAPQGAIQRIDLALGLADARFATDTPVAIRRGRIDGTLLLDPAGVSIDGKVVAQGLRRGPLTLARLSLSAAMRGGVGRVSGTVAGSRGRAFQLSGAADLAPNVVSVTGGGTIDQLPVRLTGPARLSAEGAGWRLAPVGLEFAGGRVNVAGRFGGGAFAVDAALDKLPLTIVDVLAPGLGLGGTASGRISFAQASPQAAPTGGANLTIRGLTRAGLVVSSNPIDVGVIAKLDANGLAARAAATSGGRTIGRAQMRAAPFGAGGDLATRLSRAPLFAQLRYNGPADTLWRLTGVETIDLSGPIAVAADAMGTLADPQIRGVLRTNAGRLESAITGTVITNLRAAGRFNGSRLVLDTLAGSTPEGGSLTGAGSFGLSAERGFTIDLALNAGHALLLNRDDIGATVTGPLTIKSDRSGGTIGGDLVLDKSRFRLGAAAAAAVPRLAVKEINRPADEMADDAPPAPWRLALKARARNQLAVRGLGLDSEWRADLSIRGTVDNPAIGGQAVFIRGGYEFAGRRFDLQRGTIRFTGEAPPDPLLDIVATASVQGLNATIHVTGTGLKPEIDFSSIPALPEDELLSRLLFGTSITNLSAPEALQLAAAVASLRNSGGGGGLGLDPINAIRRATGLDRLRILPADTTTGQGTSVAAGKYIGRRTYVELITDGAGYSATRVEFQITRWLSILSSISTIGRQSANVRVSRDY